jgi:hypothetical protein
MGNSSVARRYDHPSHASMSSPADPGIKPAMTDAAPGWYYDPQDKAVYRYWDGGVWTEHKSEVFLTTTP